MDTTYSPRNEHDEYNYALCKFQYHSLWGMLTVPDAPQKYEDAPISLQLVARRYEEEKLLAAMEYIQKLI